MTDADAARMLKEIDDHGENLNDWELGFVVGLVDSRKTRFSARQRQIIEQIHRSRMPEGWTAWIDNPKERPRGQRNGIGDQGAQAGAARDREGQCDTVQAMGRDIGDHHTPGAARRATRAERWEELKRAARGTGRGAAPS